MIIEIFQCDICMETKIRVVEGKPFADCICKKCREGESNVLERIFDFIALTVGSVT